MIGGKAQGGVQLLCAKNSRLHWLPILFDDEVEVSRRRVQFLLIGPWRVLDYYSISMVVVVSVSDAGTLPKGKTTAVER